ncbi:MAG: hypothetical protein ACRC1K_25435 [Planctomycetia bacterium]
MPNFPFSGLRVGALLTACAVAATGAATFGEEPPTEDAGTPVVFEDAPSARRWFGRADALWLQRAYPEDFTIARTVDRAAQPIEGGVVNLDDVADGSAAPGLRAWLGLGSADSGVELGYFGLQQWSRAGVVTVQDPPFANSPFLGNSIPFANKSFDTTMTVNYESEIHNVELNARRGGCFSGWNAAAVGGFRYFNLAETIGVEGVETFTRTVESTRTETDNNLFGAQIGGEASRTWLDDRLGLTLGGKAGLFANCADQETVNGNRPFNGAAGQTVLDAGRGATDAAGLYEASATATVRLTRRVVARVGYQVMFVQGLALAPEQLALTGTSLRDFPQTPLPAGVGSRLRTDGDLFLHGPSAGLEISF